MTMLVLALRGCAAIVVLTTLVGGIPRIAQAALAITLGLWSGVLAAMSHTIDVTWAVALHEVAIGAALGVLGAVPLLAASSAGRLVDLASAGRAQGPYAALFGVLAAGVFVGIDGHIAVLTGIVDSHAAIPSIAITQPHVLEAIAHVIPAAIRLAVPWLVTAAVVQIAIGIGLRLAERTSHHAPAAAAVPAALVMMTAALVSTLAVAIVALVRASVG